MKMFLWYLWLIDESAFFGFCTVKMGKVEPSNKVPILTSNTELSDDVSVNGSINLHDPRKLAGHDSDDFAMLDMTSSVFNTHQTEPFSSRIHWFGWFYKQFLLFLVRLNQIQQQWYWSTV